MKKLFLFSLNIISLFFISLSTVSAQDRQPGNAQINLGNNQNYGIKITNPNVTVGNLISNALLIMYIVGGLVVLIFLIWGAFDWITSGGDKEKVSGARRKIMNAFIGLALLALAAFLVTLVGQVVGINPLGTGVIPRLDDPPTTP